MARKLNTTGYGSMDSVAVKQAGTDVVAMSHFFLTSAVNVETAKYGPMILFYGTDPAGEAFKFFMGVSQGRQKIANSLQEGAGTIGPVKLSKRTPEAGGNWFYAFEDVAAFELATDSTLDAAIEEAAQEAGGADPFLVP